MSRSEQLSRQASSRNTNNGVRAGSLSTQAAGVPSPGSTHASQVDKPASSRQAQSHQKFVFTDPVALRYLEEDASTHVLARRQKLVGYESYLVEQWACSRTHPTFIITTYTGDPGHAVICGVLSAPIDETSWSPRLKVYFKALAQYHARKRETPLGTLMVTNLSAFPSSLTVIPIPEGDPTKYRQDFFVNENLKRLGCSGRVGLTLSKPAGSTISKFYQLYKASDKVPIGQAVIELVNFCQVALTLFNKLEPEYADGLLCDLTEKALSDWWPEFGIEFYNMEPHDGILGPTTVAGLLGLLMGARNRLHAYGAPVSKDVFDIEHTKRGIAYFQKTQRMSRSRRLDQSTLSRLHRATAKAANSEGWAVPRAIRGTVAELGGKGGEMVMDIVGAREKSGITEVETCDIDQFVASLGGARAKWLWHGKSRKGQSFDIGSNSNHFDGEGSLEFHGTEEGGYEWSKKRKETSAESPRSGFTRSGTHDSQRSKDGADDRQRLQKRNTDTSAKDQDSSRVRGLFKGAVGVNNHRSRPSREYDEPDRPGDIVGSSKPTPVSEGEVLDSGNSSADPFSFSTGDRRFGPSSSLLKKRQRSIQNTPDEAIGHFSQHLEPPFDEEKESGPRHSDRFGGDYYPLYSTTLIADSTYHGIDLDEVLPHPPECDVSNTVKRRHSSPDVGSRLCSGERPGSWPRQNSFSVAEESVCTWPRINEMIGASDILTMRDPIRQLQVIKANSDDAKEVRWKLLRLETTLQARVDSSMQRVQQIDDRRADEHETLDSVHHARLEAYKTLQEHSQQILGHEKSALEESLRGLEVLGAKLEYEVAELRSKVEDVEDGVDEFARQVRGVEDRVRELEHDMRPRQGWGQWLVNIITGIGQRPETGSETGIGQKLKTGSEKANGGVQ